MKIRSYYVQILAALLVVTTILLMWFGYRATAEWQRSTRQVVDRRTVEVLYLMVTALSRDMRGVQNQVLPQLNPSTNDAEMYELSDEIAKAFARFPYAPSMEGQYILKNLVLISACIVVGGSVRNPRGGTKVTNRNGDP